jgi:hypothetical protein
MAFFGFLAAPLGKDQPNDVWAAAQLRFLLKNRVRIWDQSGMQELVHITVPKRQEKIYTNGLNQHEVRSRLSALSTTIDSRGWAIKNSNINYSPSPQFDNQFDQASDDRLVGASILEKSVPISDVTAADDILDQDNNSLAHKFDEEIKRQEQIHKDRLKMTMLQGAPLQAPVAPANPQDFYFLNQPSILPESTPVQPLATFGTQVIAPGTEYSEVATAPASDTDPSAQALLEKIHHDQEIARDISMHSHEKVIKTSEEVIEEERLKDLEIAEQKRLTAEDERRIEAEEELARKTREQTAPDAILKELSQSELKISTLAVQAKHSTEVSNNDGEVVISLH